MQAAAETAEKPVAAEAEEKPVAVEAGAETKTVENASASQPAAGETPAAAEIPSEKTETEEKPAAAAEVKTPAAEEKPAEGNSASENASAAKQTGSEASEAVKKAADQTVETVKKISAKVAEGTQSLMDDVQAGKTAEGFADVKKNGVKGIVGNFTMLGLVVLICSVLILLGVLLPFYGVSVLGFTESFNLFQTGAGSDKFFGFLVIVLACIGILTVLAGYRRKKFEVWQQFVLMIGCFVVFAICLMAHAGIKSELGSWSDMASPRAGFYLMVIFALIEAVLMLMYMNMNTEGYFFQKKAAKK
jgi:cobalamin biosynthesis Mg chelatase CobN